MPKFLKVSVRHLVNEEKNDAVRSENVKKTEKLAFSTVKFHCS
jgi:hypothetical protein